MQKEELSTVWTDSRSMGEIIASYTLERGWNPEFKIT